MYQIEQAVDGGVRVTLPGGETDGVTGEYSSVKAAVDAIKNQKRNKYGARKVRLDGYLFDSVKEANRYMELVALWRAGEIAELRVHPRFEVHPKFKDGSGRWHRAIRYEADFSYVENGRVVVEDVKGGTATITAVFRIKAKLFMRRFPDIDFRVVQ